MNGPSPLLTVAGARLVRRAEIHARTGDLLAHAKDIAPAPFVVTCFSDPLDTIAACRAILLSGADAEPWQYTPNTTDWREIARRSRRLKRMETPPALLISQEMRATFSDDDIRSFGEICVVEPGGGAATATATAAQSAAISGERILFLETAGATAHPRVVALSCTALAARIGAQASAENGPVIRLLPASTVEACSQIIRPDPESVWIDHRTAAGRPECVLEAVAHFRASEIKLTPGHASRLLNALRTVQRPPDLSSLRLIEISGGPAHPQEAEDLLKALSQASPSLRLQVVYRTLEAGAIRMAEATAGTGVARDGRHCALPITVGGAVARIVDAEFNELGQGVYGEIQVRNEGRLALAYRNPNGRRTPMTDGAGWLKTGDYGAITPTGLVVASTTGESYTVPRRTFSLAKVEARVRTVQGLLPETVAVLPPIKKDEAPDEDGDLEVFFDTTLVGAERINQIASEIFTTVVAQTGVQPNVYRVRPDQTPMTAGLTPRRAHLARLVRVGVLRAVAAPSLLRRNPEEIASHERLSMVAEIWRDILNLDYSPGEKAEFFQLGADSLNLTTMLDQVEARFGVAVDIEAFFSNPTLGGIASLLADAAAAAKNSATVADDGGDAVARLARFTSAWRGERPFPDSLIRSANAAGERPPLFWIMQSEQTFLDLAEALGPDQPLHAFRSAVGVVEHYTVGALESISNRYLWELLGLSGGRPFFLGGNCQGAILALTLARRLRQIGRQPSRLIMMEWFFDFGGYEGPTTFLTGSDSFVAELQATAPSLQRLSEQFPDSAAHDIPGSHGEFFRGHLIGGLVGGIRKAMSDG